MLLLLIITILLLSYFAYLAWKEYLKDKDKFLQFIAILVADVGIIVSIVVVIIREGSEFNITKIFSEWFGQKIDYPSDCDLDNILVYDGHTYAICETQEIDDFWDAEELCKEHNGHLAVINTEAENTKLYDYFIKGLKKESAYFGYTDHNDEGHWYWVDGSPSREEGGFENWYEKPNNRNGVEDFALFWHKDPDYTWNDGDFGKNSADKVIFIIEWDFVDKSLK